MVWNMNFIFHFIYGLSSFPLTHIFQDGWNQQPVIPGWTSWSGTAFSEQFILAASPQKGREEWGEKSGFVELEKSVESYSFFLLWGCSQRRTPKPMLGDKRKSYTSTDFDMIWHAQKETTLSFVAYSKPTKNSCVSPHLIPSLPRPGGTGCRNGVLGVLGVLEVLGMMSPTGES